jgi:predicted dehydrogenase
VGIRRRYLDLSITETFRVKPPPLGVGVIGLGDAAGHHLPALLSLPEVRLIALADVDRQRLKDRSERFRVKTTFDDYRRLLDHPGIDIVAVLTPPSFHLEMALAAIDAGKHILLEKPITATLEEAHILCEKARESRGKICVAYNLRFARQVQLLREVLQTGRLGTIEILRCFASTPSMLGSKPPTHRGDRKQGGGSIIELGVHHYDLWSYLLGSKVADVTAATRSSFMHDQSSVVAGCMANGTLVTTCISLCAAEQYEIELLGSAGRARSSLYRYDGFEVLQTGQTAGGAGARAAGLWRSISGFPHAVHALRHGGDFLESFRDLWRHLTTCILEDRTPEPDLQAGLDSLAVAVAVSNAAREGPNRATFGAGSG